jgi:serine/threonine-protein kinase
VLKQYCCSCHQGDGSEGGGFDALVHQTLVAPREGDKSYVIPGKPAESLLFQRMALRRGGKGDMPPQSVPEAERPTDAAKAVVKAWIEAGAPAFPARAPARAFLPLAGVLAEVRDDLHRADREARSYLRYFTLHHLYNNPKVLDEDLPVYRAALSKALNSLSWKPRVVLPRAIDKAQTLFAIDVRDLGWDRDDLWQEVLKAYPYGLKFRNHPDLQEIDEDICDLTGCGLSLVRADWFVAAATRPPLYHALLRLPNGAGDLERRLGVDVAAGFLDPAPQRIARAGFVRSGVSGQNRLVERHETEKGVAYWKSYDFRAGNARGKLTRFPLGPLRLFPPGKHPFPDQAFVHDGGEIIFSLPNGLQGYLLVNGKDERIDEGPIQVVGDQLKTSGTPAIVTGLSCMACHKHGMIHFKDGVRDRSAVFGDVDKRVKQLYPESGIMDRLVKKDEDRFLAALEKAVGPFLRGGADGKKPLKEFAEPVGEVARVYRVHRLGYLDLKTVACELDIMDPKMLMQKVGETKLKRLGLEALLNEGGVIGRAEWEAVDGVSLMQEVARELRYTPWRMPR